MYHLGVRRDGERIKGVRKRVYGERIKGVRTRVLILAAPRTSSISYVKGLPLAAKPPVFTSFTNTLTVIRSYGCVLTSSVSEFEC
jgi:hypothetical protein